MCAVRFIFRLTFYYRVSRRRSFKIAENVFYTMRFYEPFRMCGEPKCVRVCVTSV